MQTPCGHQSKEKVDARFLCVDSGFCGQVQFVKDTRRLYRTDFFPGLGWMLRRQLWEELR